MRKPARADARVGQGGNYEIRERRENGNGACFEVYKEKGN